MQRSCRIALVAASLLAVMAGCSSTIHRYTRVGTLDTLSLDAKQRLVLTSQARGHQEVCAEPSPDAIVAVSAAFAGQGSGDLATGENIKAAISGGSSETAASIALRTATVQVLRDGYYRLCEGYMNQAFDSEQYANVLAEIGPFIATVSAVDAIGGQVHPPAVAISGGATTAGASGGAGADSTVKSVAGAGIRIEAITAEDGTEAAKVASRQVAAIVARYLQHRRLVAGELIEEDFQKKMMQPPGTMQGPAVVR